MGLLSGAAHACWGVVGEGAAVYSDSNGATQIRGLRGVSNLRITDSLGSNEAHAHPAQLTGLGNNDFAAIGNLRTSRTIDNCLRDIDLVWDVYIDGAVFGDYWCRTLINDNDVPVSADDFKLVRGGPCANSQMGFYWDGAARWCRTNTFTGSWRAVLGLEIQLGSANADVRFYNTELKLQGRQLWLDFRGDALPALGGGVCEDAGYDVDQVNDRQVKLFKPPYD